MTVLDKISTKNEITLDLIMSQVEIEMDILKKELNSRFISKETFDSNEYQNRRKVGDIERLLNQTRDELSHQKNLL